MGAIELRRGERQQRRRWRCCCLKRVSHLVAILTVTTTFICGSVVTLQIHSAMEINNDTTADVTKKTGSTSSSNNRNVTRNSNSPIARYGSTSFEQSSCRRAHVILKQIRVYNRTATNSTDAATTTTANINREDDTDNKPTSLRLPPKILCFIMSHSGYHDTRIKAVWETWGKRCDKLVVTSDKADPTIGAIEIKDSPSTYLGLWHKLNSSMQYIYETYRHHDYEWIMKADDDTYMIVENLKAYLSSPEVQMQHQQGEPLIYGRRYGAPKYYTLRKRPKFFNNSMNRGFSDRFFDKMNPKDPAIYCYGG